MSYRSLGAMLAGLALLPLPAAAQGAITLKSVHVTLPGGFRPFPGTGPGADAINANCLACHSAGMVLNQPNMPKAAWETEVHKMIGAFKAPVVTKDIPAIVDYLVATKGVKETKVR